MKKALQTLTRRLEQLGYTELLCACMPVSEHTARWAHLRNRADASLVPLIDLLLLGRNVPMELLDKEIAGCVPALAEGGILRKSKDGLSVATANLVLVPVWGVWLLHERPNPKISLYFGDDSLALLSRQMPRRGGTSLDLCSGPGIQALYAAAKGEKVTSVEINPMARALASVNAQMNGLDECMDIRLGDLYGAIGDNEKFDRIMANPPLLPMPDEISYPFIGHGGNDGFAVTWKILEGMGKHLRDGGSGQVLGMGLGDGNTPLFVPKLQEIAAAQGLDARVTVLMHSSCRKGGAYFEGLASTSQAFGGGNLEEIRTKMEECYVSQGASELITYYIQMTHGSGEVTVCDIGKEVRGVLWYV